MATWTVGDVKITAIEEIGIGPDVLGPVLPQATAESIKDLKWLFPHFVDAQGHPKGSVQAFVVETPTKRIIVDTCVGDHKTFETLFDMWGNLQTGFLEKLTRAGYPPESIDTVLCTHLHLDHIGWNTRLVGGKWVPTFRNARYLFGRTEYELERQRFETAPADDPAMQTFNAAHVESIKPVIDAGLVDLVETDHVICKEARLVPSPGHTAGHVSLKIASRGKEALITGDFMHHPCQCAHPDWSSAFDFDPKQSTETRKRLLKALAGSRTLVLGTHFAAPTAGRIRREGKAYRFEIL